ncbi:MAG: protein-glutamate O-methyltransferase CheR [Pseudomonadota bacterium]
MSALVPLSDQEFGQFQRFIFEAAGITMGQSKKALVGGRLAKRLAQHQLGNYGDYLRLLKSGQADAEMQIAIDLLTTNETYFFREPKHFAFLREQALAARGRAAPFRVWSAASSSGEEAYSAAMVLADCLEQAPWEVLGSDISTRVLARARAGHYALERTENIPKDYLRRFCLKGVDSEAGTMLVERTLRQRVQFSHANLNETLPQLGQFDVIFLRNVMIYFSGDTKRQVVARVLGQLKPGGHLLVGHSETLNDISSAVRALAPAIYRKE